MEDHLRERHLKIEDARVSWPPVESSTLESPDSFQNRFSGTQGTAYVTFNTILAHFENRSKRG